jgi:5-deoxy-glucuronate isomerase
VTLGGTAAGTAARHGGVFASAPVAAYAPPACELRLDAVSDATVAVAAAPPGDGTAGPPRLIPPEERQVRTAGTGNWERTIRTLLGPGDEAARLIVGETINPPGNWSSYPPHKHDRQAPPEEVALEEVYYYRFDPPGGFGVQLLYDDAGEHAHVVHDGGVVPIASGYHPVVAAPGYSLYYLWVMAGEGRELAPYLDPRHAWVQG